jgi:hypothetical protein
MQLSSIFSVVFISSACWYIFPSGDICLSGAIIFHKEEEIELKRAVSNRGSILLAEIIAIKNVLDYVYATSSMYQDNSVPGHLGTTY